MSEARAVVQRSEVLPPLCQVVVDWIEGCQPECEDFDLVSNYPRREFARAQRTSTLEALGLHPAATLFTKEA
eukprot:2441962-Pleurochrysis_carterae.AAC.1